MSLGIDASEFQEGEPPWALCDFAIIRATIGYRMDARFTQHRAALSRTGKPFAFYHAILAHNASDPTDTHPPLHYDPARQVDAFLQIVGAEDLAPIWVVDPLTGVRTLIPRVWVDVEAVDVDAALLLAFIKEFQRRRPGIPIGIYSSANAWRLLIGPGHVEFADFPLWCAEYPNAALALKYPQAPWPPFLPDLPDIWPRPLIFQFRFKKGYWPTAAWPADKDLDTNVLIPPLEAPVIKPSPIVAAGSKLGMHAIRPGQVIPLVRQAHDRGVVWPLVKAVDNGGVAIDVKAIEPRTRTITRFVDLPEDAAQGVATWTPADMRAHAGAALDFVWGRLNAQERAAADWIEPINEADPPGVAGWQAFGEYLKVIIDEGNQRGMKLALPAFNAGTPEWDEAQALVATGVFGVMKAGGHILTIHEGVFGAAAVDQDWPGSIPGAPAVAGGGPLCFRYRFLYSLLVARGEVVPLVISEFYAGGSYHLSPAEQVTRFAWYDRQARKDSYVLAVLPFTIDPDDTWKAQDYTYAYGAVLDYVTAEKDIPNATEGDTMPITKAERQALLDQANALATTAGTQLAGANALISRIAALVPDDAAHVWKAGDVALANTNPLVTYVAPGGAVKDRRPATPGPMITYDLNVVAVSADGQWLEVAPNLWVKVADVKLKV